MMYILAALIGTLCVSCVNSSKGEVYSLALQHGFESSSVQVWVDNNLYYKGKVTTDSSLGLAHLISNIGPCSEITLKVRCDDGSEFVRTFRLTHRGGGHIGINFDPVLKEMEFEQQKKPFSYY